jgi:hypothetical protein
MAQEKWSRTTQFFFPFTGGNVLIIADNQDFPNSILSSIQKKLIFESFFNSSFVFLIQEAAAFADLPTTNNTFFSQHRYPSQQRYDVQEGSLHQQHGGCGPQQQ